MKKAGGPVMHRLITVSMLVLAIAIGGYTQTKRLATNSFSSPMERPRPSEARLFIHDIAASVTWRA